MASLNAKAGVSWLRSSVDGLLVSVFLIPLIVIISNAMEFRMHWDYYPEVFQEYQRRLPLASLVAGPILYVSVIQHRGYFDGSAVFRFWQPFVGGSVFVCMQAVGWITYSVSSVYTFLCVASALDHVSVFAMSPTVVESFSEESCLKLPGLMSTSSILLVIASLWMFNNNKKKVQRVLLRSDSGKVQLSGNTVAVIGATLTVLSFVIVALVEVSNVPFLLSSSYGWAVPVACVAGLVGVPLTHWAGSRMYGSTYAVWQPFAGGRAYMMLQAFGWFLYSCSNFLVVVCFIFWLKGVTLPETVGLAVGLLLGLAEVCVIASLFYFEESKGRKNTPTSNSAKTTSPKTNNATSSPSTAVACIIGHDVAWTTLALVGLVTVSVSFSGALLVDILLDFVGVKLLSVIPLSIIVVTAFVVGVPLTHMAGQQRYGDCYSIYQPFLGGTKFCVLQALGWMAYSLSVVLMGMGVVALRLQQQHVSGLFSSVGASAFVSQLLITSSLEVFEPPIRRRGSSFLLEVGDDGNTTFTWPAKSLLLIFLAVDLIFIHVCLNFLQDPINAAVLNAGMVFFAMFVTGAALLLTRGGGSEVGAKTGGKRGAKSQTTPPTSTTGTTWTKGGKRASLLRLGMWSGYLLVSFISLLFTYYQVIHMFSGSLASYVLVMALSTFWIFSSMVLLENSEIIERTAKSSVSWATMVVISLVFLGTSFVLSVSFEVLRSYDLFPKRSVGLASTFLFLAGVPLTHLAGSRKYSHSSFKFYQPFRGGVRFVLFQAVGWALYAAVAGLSLFYVMYMVFYGDVPDVGISGVLSASSVHAVVAQLLILVSLTVFEESITSEQEPLPPPLDENGMPVETDPPSWFRDLKDFAITAFGYSIHWFYLFTHVIGMPLVYGWEGFLVMVVFHLLYLPTYRGKPHMTGSRQWSYAQNAHWFHESLRRYFSGRVLRTTQLDSKCNYVFGFHPHGIYPVTCFWATNGHQWRHFFPGIKPVVLGASAMFFTPWMRDLLMWMGAQEVSRDNIEDKLGKKQSILLIPGGQAEMALQDSKNPYVQLIGRHKGFIRLAVKYGVPLVPCFSFGESHILDNVRIKSIQSFIYKHTRALYPHWPVGRWGSPWPNKVPVTVVVGTPIPVKQMDEPSKEYIDELAKTYFGQVTEIFEKHHAECGYPDQKLRIVE